MRSVNRFTNLTYLFILLELAKLVLCQTNITINLISLSNPRGIKATGECCDGVGNCQSNPCDPQITVCVSSDASRKCDIGVYNTQFYDENDITFKDSISFANYKTTTNIYLGFTINDIDKENDRELIEKFTDVINLTKKDIEKRQNLNGKVSSFIYSYKINCIKNYYGINCQKHCVNNSHYYCSKNGRKICLNDWFGYNCSVYCKNQDNDETGHYICNKNGQKICQPYWFGKNCTKYCIPSTSQRASYKCDDNGSKICLKNWHGKNCDNYCNSSEKSKYICDHKTGEKLCFANWFGKNCDTSCEATSTSNFYCDKTNGNKICMANYFGRNCTTYCNATSSSNYTCDGLGKKICKKNFHGFDCQFYVPELPKTKSTCSISKNGLITTFDQRLYTFHGDCIYQIAADCIDELFAIHMKTDPFCLPPNCNIYVNIYFGTKEIRLSEDNITINNITITLPYLFEGLSIYQFGQYTFVKNPYGVTLYYDTENNFFLELAPSHANKTCGLCGNYNALKEDDTISPFNGKILPEKDLPAIWKRESIGETCQVQHPSARFQQKEKRSGESISVFCKVVYDKKFSKCAQVVNQTDYYMKCLDQLASCKNLTYDSCLCNFLTQYSRQCSTKVSDLNWRSDKLCGIKCSNNLVYKECGTACEKSCQNLFQHKSCRNDCIDGCFCPNNKIIHKGRCIEKEECPCVHNKVQYKSGENFKKDCNTCTCSSGKWKCTNKPCPGKCTAFGDPHFKTFDGKWFDFNGICKYTLAKDCVANTFAVVVENVACDEFRDFSCAKSVVLLLNHTKIILSQHGRVLVDNTLVMLPYSSSGITIRKVSSLFVQLKTALGVQILFDGSSRLYLQVSYHFKDKTCGLCGNFNDKQSDDFTTPENSVENDVVSFASSWKADPSCKAPKAIVLDPCKINIQKENIAKKKCSKLRTYPFSQCHHVVSVDEYIHACQYDTCGCIDGIGCLCNAIAAYTKECAENGVVINWRNQNIFPECAISCSKGQVYQECGNICKNKCKDLSSRGSCTHQCIAGCNCPNGTIENDIGECVSESKCHCYHEGNRYFPGHTMYTEKCKKCICKNGKFECKLDEKLCKGVSKCPTGQLWSTSTKCTRTCTSLHVPCMNQFPVAGCRCPNDTVWNEKQKKCVDATNCPCHYNGRSYEKGEFYKWDCNTCTCVGNHWSCTQKRCHGTCSVYGDPHYTSFDGKKFLFEGRCNYMLAQDFCNENPGNFSVQVENVACGSTGSTCTKLVSIQILDTQIILEKGRPLRNRSLSGFESSVAHFIHVQHFFYDIIYSDIGLTILWDRDTRVLINLHPKFKGRTCGLCGNFNDNQNDDFMTPELDTVVKAEMFGDSWKVDSSCPETKVLQHPCSLRKERSKWSQKQCNILNKSPFTKCHSVVDPRPYFDACYFDTCGCDSGGDCNCLCTAVSVYAEACSQQGVYIKWRSQEFCPIQCEKCQEYLPCGPSNPKTCQNMCHPITELPIKCVEGCFCTNDTVLHNGKCIKPDECPCFLNGKKYTTNATLYVDCQKCVCKDGCFKCDGEKCLSTTTSPILSTSSSSSTTAATTSESTKSTPTTGKTSTISTAKSTVNTTVDTTTFTTKPRTSSNASTTTATSPTSTSTTKKITKASSSTSTTEIKSTTQSPIETTTSVANATSKPKVTTTQYITNATTKSKVSTTEPVKNTTISIKTEEKTTRISSTTKSTTVTTQSTTNATTTAGILSTSSTEGTTKAATTPIVANTTTKHPSTTSEIVNKTTKLTTSTSTKLPSTSSSTTTDSSTESTTTKPSTASTSTTLPSTTPSTTKESESTTTTTESKISTTKHGKTPTTAKITSTTEQSTLPPTNASTYSTTSNKPSTTGTTSTTAELTTKGRVTECFFNKTVVGYQCKNSRFCIPKSDICDTLKNCPNGDDEENCPTLPPTRQPTGPTSPGYNITTTTERPAFCNGYLCKDDTNERYCIKKWYYCDGISDCPYGDDENNEDCKHIITEATTSTITDHLGGKSTPVLTTSTTVITPTHTTASNTTITTEFVCESTPDTYPCSDKSNCINARKICNSIRDCYNGEDEKGCPHSCSLCSHHDFKCHKTCQCIAPEFVCDGSNDCGDGSDEIGCKVSTTPITTTSTTISTKKPIICPKNQIYKECTFLCENKCNHLLKDCVEDFRVCQPGCTCPYGLVNNGTDCVLRTSCPCFDEDLQVYYDSNEKWKKGCQICVCFNGTAKCQQKKCDKFFCPSPSILIRRPGECCESCVKKIKTTAQPVTTTPKKVCLDNEFQCKKSGKCIPEEWRCDRERDCLGDASDERGCQSFKDSCFEPLGVSDKKIIPDNALSASSQRGYYYRPQNGRLNAIGKVGHSAGAWCPKKYAATPHWIQVDLGNIYLLSKVSLQGRYYVTQFVTSFKLKYSMNGNAWLTFKYKGKEKIFDGVHSVHQIRKVKLDKKIRARYVRILPHFYHNQPCVRFELFGCLNQTITPPPTIPPSTTTAPPVTTPCLGFTCDNGKCIANRLVCNGIKNCNDGTDEQCNKNCSDSQMQCGNGYCLDRRFVCDGDEDCFDGRDELNCKPKSCSPKEFMCRNGECIMNRLVCDGDNDCFHGDDETNCTSVSTPNPTSTSTTLPTPCPGFLCKVNNHCLTSFDFVCDGYKDCPSLGEDERCCNKQTHYLCPSDPGEFLGQCIGRAALCDDFTDCKGGYDEMNCTSTTPKAFTTISTTTKARSTTRGIKTRPVPSKCPRNSTCICERSCDSIADNPDGCSSLHCTDECECPKGYKLNPKTKYCDRIVDNCPCTYQGKVYKIGDVIIKDNCSKCMCMENGFSYCAQYCPLQFCPEGEEIVYAGKCCKCQKKIVCRHDQIVSPCACSRKCGETDYHCGSNCVKGCMCPKGTYDNGTNCVTKPDCYCTTSDGEKHKSKSRWRNGTCDICKCEKGVVTCGKTCSYFKCPDGFELVRPKNKCCYCKQVTTTTTSTPTGTGGSTELPTKHPLYRCTKFEEKVIYKNKNNCTSISSIIRSKCSGSCHTSVVVDFFKGVTMRDCTCCRPESFQSAVAKLSCPNGTIKTFTYKIIDKCGCKNCDSSPFHDVSLVT